MEKPSEAEVLVASHRFRAGMSPGDGELRDKFVNAMI
jgi:hypothetical protein